jgi:hypothetical protein
MLKRHACYSQDAGVFQHQCSGGRCTEQPGDRIPDGCSHPAVLCTGAHPGQLRTCLPALEVNREAVLVCLHVHWSIWHTMWRSRSVWCLQSLPCDVTISGQPFGPNSLTFGLPKNSSLLTTLNRALLEVRPEAVWLTAQVQGVGVWDAATCMAELMVWTAAGQCAVDHLFADSRAGGEQRRPRSADQEVDDGDRPVRRQR